MIEIEDEVTITINYWEMVRNTMRAECTVKLVTSTSNKDLKRALTIYRKEVPVNIRTNENEILQYISSKDRTKKREMLFYILYCNDIVIGYCEVGALKQSKAFFIDYFILEQQYKNNAYFYMCYNLLVEDLQNRFSDFKYIIAEYYNQSEAKSIDSSLGKKCLSLEGFKIIDKKYIQPGLNGNDPDSVVECQLLLKELCNINTLQQLSAQKYISLLRDIYTNHYIEWYSHFLLEEEFLQYCLKIEEFLDKTIKKCGERNINLLNYTYINCKYYSPSKCELSINNPFRVPKKHRKIVYYTSLAVLLVLANLIAFSAYLLFARIFKLSDSIISIVFPITLEIVIFLGSKFTIKFNS